MRTIEKALAATKLSVLLGALLVTRSPRTDQRGAGAAKATAEVLKAISRSTFELQLVLDTLIENAVRVGVQRGDRRDGNVYRGVAFYKVSPELVDYSTTHP
jgi:hypothetical protein